jgi:predicted metal-binding membrane protein
VEPVVDTPFALERLIRRDRAVVALGLAAIALLAWAYLVRMASGMHAAAMDAEIHAAMGMPGMRTWGAMDLVMLFLMWNVMMIGMMLPSAAPLMLMVVGTYRRRGPGARGLTTAFVTGYLVAWTAFSAAAALMQTALHQAALLSPGMASRSPVLAGGILLIAGTYQWLPLKNACLTRCRSPLDFLSRPVHGSAAWALLCRLLLGAHGAALRRGRDESRVGRGHCRFRACRKAHAARRSRRTRRRHRILRLGRLPADSRCMIFEACKSPCPVPC